ncbi:MAG: TonB-dependent receptor, partial [Phenylobacterium sp.]|nr:TonB-dependent receptor [Phenylobacterium sp.]
QVSWQHNRYTKYNEISLCSSQAWRQVAGGTCDPAIIPATTQILIDHAKGVLTIAGVPATAGRPAVAAQTFNFRPDRFNVPLTWSIRPEIRFEQWLGEDVTAGLNIYHSDGEQGFGAGPSNLAGVTPFVVQAWTGPVSGLDAYSYPKYTNVDFNADWHRIKGSNVSAYARITNLTNKRYRVGGGDTFVSGGVAAPSPNEPRMFLMGVRYDF